MQALVRLAASRPVAVSMVFLAVLVAGYLSWGRLPIDLLPDIASPKVVVSVTAGDRAPEEMEEKFGEPIESRLVTVRHMAGVSSISRNGRILVTVEFHWNTDMDLALIDVQKAVGELASDPDVDTLTVQRFDPRAAPILTLALVPGASAPLDLDQLRRLARDQIQRGLERIEGVAEVRLLGGRTREVWVVPDRYRLKAFGLTTDDVESRIRAANVDTPGGTLEEGATLYAVRGLGRFRGLDDVAAVTVGWRVPDPASATAELVPVRLGDVAEVRHGEAEIENMVVVDGREGVSLALYKEAGANTVQVTRRVQEALGRLAEDVPGVELRVVGAQARYVEQAITEVEQAAAVGIALAVVVLLLFLRSLAPTAIVGVAIPVSIVATLVMMFAADLTLNVMTLGGLALGAGMLVDNAIVVVESIFRHLEKGRDRWTAVVEGAAEVGGAITASTLTTVVVFVPIVFIEGVAARLFEEQALTVGFSLLASLLVALVLIPMLAARWLLPRPAGSDERHPLLGRAVAACLRARVAVVVVAALLFGGAMLAARRIGTEFLPQADQGELAIKLRLAEGTRVESTAAAVATVEQAVRECLGDAVEGIYGEIGLLPEDPHLLREESTGENSATLRLALAPSAHRRSVPALIAVLDPVLTRLPAEVSYQTDTTGLSDTIGVGAAPLTVEVRGRDLETLRGATEDVRRALASVPSLYNVVTSFQQGPPELRLELDRVTAAGLGLELDTIASQIRTRIDGTRVTSFQADDDERWVVVRFPQVDARDLPSIELDAPGRGPVLLSDVARAEPGEGAREIYRKDQGRLGTVGAHVRDGVTFSRAVADVRRAIAEVTLPPGYRAAVGGEEAERSATFRQLGLAALLAVGLIYMVLASLFESLVHPFTIMLTVPLALIGVVGGLLVRGLPFGVMAAIGTILLAGIAVNGSIVLVDHVTHLRRRGVAREQALVEAAKVRLRPILMTSLTTMLALVPLALGVGTGASLRAPLAVAVIGGLLTSTVMTLFVVPCLYSLLDDLRPQRVREERARAAGAPRD